ncbi:MAG: nucleotidyltransferase family protein [Dehalococcoidia bacterium]|jgi:predicted nucleotidyltransferase|uniref:nucleotidyltransferase family protein n=1 Tax=Candidatus Amarobacter glycogenicus TaxID=3140699 RepID=UPI002A16996C|nr:nucleotidyltransferase family protein [Dehalococcoidia bacterium]MBK7124391.1 nucleotidyltransferase family protein [Dehalococcoidia bacterium]MBK7328255.1 nucleotidyltransferase family protein [Dehalococcoidia bacterium]MBK8560605.1 nucleotidyltransferase family protein [Dehalococcoidia bacterium]MBK9610304.1 nucleotidyltransferase family protein [Dehalococcoidia bacterium]
MDTDHRLTMPKERLEEFCRRNWIRRLSLFGSVLRDDFGPESDVDVLVEFEVGHVPGFAFVSMADELATILGRPVDFVTTRGLNKYIREQVLAEAEALYVAA